MANKVKKYQKYNVLPSELRNEFCTWFVHQDNTDLPQEKIDTFEEIKEWFLTVRWSDMFKELKQYVTKHRNFPPTTDKTQLTRWIATQQQNKKTNILLKTKIKRLETIKGWVWDI